ncbi:TetR-family transcriptional regulator [Alloalcanivorax dieselolei B5]|uniref:TetR-family transcriptional regulator n=1 Tax=Alcanivorax dieselolei (strain DSM 16502 / CGMCC 1.3690 / MCCC 1A00001 / B-5) TaxID=930169 RepID=K0CGW1_ALCDB|nr:TetR/AcrR family transcriptional regulator [Alloalcanivorax dieselolei]AFT71630.1 TetR-family transcriptional regulator [Alloalcanivorax dieselolei B5]
MMKGRRRGADLEAALLEAAWTELTERGYGGLTMEGVANRAGTSRPVLARRWNDKAELAIAAIRHQMTKHPMTVADRGDLRTELLEYLELASTRAKGIAAVFTLFSSEYFQDTSTTPQDLRTALLAGGKETLRTLLDRAVERGEIVQENLAPPVDTLLGVLFRHHVLMTFSPPPEALREAWVDKIFLPLVRNRKS